MMNLPLSLIVSTTVVLFLPHFSSSSFVPTSNNSNNKRIFHSTSTTISTKYDVPASLATTALFATIHKNGEATGKIKEAVKKMRGTSISLGFNKNSVETISAMDMEILSQNLRKAKAASIFTSDLNAINEFSKEQLLAIGNFPGPCPIVYNGDVSNVNDAIDKGATVIVLDLASVDENDLNQDFGVDVICDVSTIQHIQTALKSGYEYAFLISNDDDDYDDYASLLQILEEIPKDAVIIYSLEAMQKNSSEISRGKEVIGLSSLSGNKIHGLMIDNACVGDDEDIKYASFVVGGLTKKASSQFAMTGLTGSTNGHFGTMSDNASIENAKWKRIVDE